MSTSASQPTVALVLAGGGARGAYEAGALSVLFPVLEARGERPRIIVGTSVGALNASFLAANANVAASTAIPEALAVWKGVSWDEVVRPLPSPGSLLRVSEYVGQVLGVPGARLDSLLDPSPLRTTLHERIDFPAIERNVAAGALDVAAVVATSSRTGRSVVFHDGGPAVPSDSRRGIDYVQGPLSEDQVLASAAIPAVFPAVHVAGPAPAQGWYIDGGTRLNTPIKPALEFGAERVVVIALGCDGPAPRRLAGDVEPDALASAGQILLGLLEDQLIADLQTLVTINGLTRLRRVIPGRKRRVPYILINPAASDMICAAALRVFREHYSGPLHALRSPSLALLARLIAGAEDTQHAELLSFLLFAPEFAEALIALGRQDAERWLEQSHDVDDLWQLGPLE